MSQYPAAHRFDLAYLVDNGHAYGWETATEPNCVLVRWLDDNDYSVLDANDESLSWGETENDAMSTARINLTDRRRKADGITPFKSR